MGILQREYQSIPREAIVGRLTKYAQESKNKFEREKRKREEEEQRVNETGQSDNCRNLRPEKKIQRESGNNKSRRSSKIPEETPKYRKQRKWQTLQRVGTNI